MTKIVDTADVRQGYNQTRSGNLWRFLPQRVSSAGLIRRRRWWWGLLAWSRWPPISFYFFYPFYPIHREAKNHLAVGGRPYQATLGGYPNRVKEVAFLRCGSGSRIPHYRHAIRAVVASFARPHAQRATVVVVKSLVQILHQSSY